jgi:methylthioribose-1-phosphate isomerase
VQAVAPPVQAIAWADGVIRIVDQTLLPAEERILEIETPEALADAIRTLKIRGAPALGIAGAMGVALAARRSEAASAEGVLEDARAAARELVATRPTAANLAWGIERVLRAAEAARGADRTAIVAVMEREALRIAEEDAEACLAMARHAQRFIPRRAVVLTHCNTGLLCTAGYGTALGAIRLAHERGKHITVIATETRPLLQGARLTAWELRRLGIPHALVADAAAAGLIARGEVTVVLVGADRIASSGDVANKVGTYALALAARQARVPFVVVAPTSTVDLSVPSGGAIPIEERAASEVTSVLGVPVAPPGTRALNPAFDVTPARLVSAIVTERGVARPPYRRSLRRLVAAPVRRRRGSPVQPSRGSGRLSR